ncbi:unnamed protein product [Paramecium octaurelia]|uniref:Uncharacterized protein n=1 Tax=Paramecium octaurelia TaxID=43137 RepID=A0A8S1TI31_PAROT|nr:unnamed protein product [Paramecium octaurelia]
MIFKNFYNLLFFLFLLISSQEISKQCVCGHVFSQAQCENSGFCNWKNGVCVLNYGLTYISENQDESTCKNFAEEDCRIQKQCGFHLGHCISFVDCIVFNKEQCQQSSYRCVSDGNKCVEMLECSNYKTELGCANKNQKGGYCFWVQEMEKQCRDVAVCEELPKYLVSHIMCKQGLDGCTVNEQGYGCIKQKDQCTKYINDFQCFESKNNSQNCFWDFKNNKCVEKVCDNLPFSQDYECKSYLSECTSNGIHCIKRGQCSDAENKIGCVTDSKGNKCEYYKNQCKIKSCETASDTLKNYQQCQDYDNLLDCVTSENGGCKQRPQTCEGYVGQVDCYSIQQQDCIWYSNKCAKRECFHAPLYYSQQDCKTGGGCQQTPEACDEILLEQFCEFNYNKQRCFWLEGICTLFECNILKLPTYKSHKICQEASSSCTFNIDSLGCKDYLCENIQEIEFCEIDSKGTICSINEGCIDKKCLTAPPNYDSNSQCEEWLPYCTVNVQELSNSKALIGCVNKKKECQFALQEQCHSTFSGIQCKWDNIGKKCVSKICTDADPSIYIENTDCNSYQVVEGTCIIGTPGFGCQLWPTSCDDLISQQQCELNLQNGTKCFWTGSLCKLLECSDASIIDYTNNIECNTWLDYCIYNSTVGGCMDRPSSVACTSSPNNSMYDTHIECQAWNPKCTVISSFYPEGCELKKTNCSDYIRQRNCRTNFAGQQCYWDDIFQKCMEQNNDTDCNKRVYGDLTHQNCESFLQKCTVWDVGNRTCVTLSSKCDYNLEQKCVITKNWQPCKWDVKNRVCKDVMCSDNMTAKTEAECLSFRKLNQCQLKIQSNGTYGPGCEVRPANCNLITNPIICKLTLTLSNEKCYFFNSKCQVVQSKYCEVITDSKSNEVCQLYNPYCVLQSSGQGCYSIYSCSDLSSNICKSAIMISNIKCSYNGACGLNNQCSDKSYYDCNGQKTEFGQLCYAYSSCYKKSCSYHCYQKTTTKNLNFDISTSILQRSKQCQDYSTNYIYNTNCQCCQNISNCSQQQGDQELCNSSTLNSNSRCGYNFQTNTCESRKCEHMTYVNYPVITDYICFNWISNCVLDATGCITYTGDCTLIKFIQQCYQENCYWQDGKCVNDIDCQINTTSVTTRECLLVNATYCRYNYTKGLGCSFYDCSHIKKETICTSSNLDNGQNCKWVSGSCYPRSCLEYTIQADCESSYGSNNFAITKCYWCLINANKCSNNKYCYPTSMVKPNSHQDCNSVSSLNTFTFQSTIICTIKSLLCSNYLDQGACFSTIQGIECYWNGSTCQNKCEAITAMPSTNQQCYDWNSNCILNGFSCQLLNCSLLVVISDCNIYTTKCFWNGSSCNTIGGCSLYSTSTLCSNTSNSDGIPCFWFGTQCLEKTCINIPTAPSSNVDCNSWLTNCQFNSNTNQCVEDCTSADNSYITHEQCESYYFNKKCTVKLDIIQCVDLPLSCALAKQMQCYLDIDGNQCYYSILTQSCLILTCSNLDSDFTTHEQCNQRFEQCTVNTTQNGCQQLNDCNSYLIQEQCYFDQNKIECEWIQSQSKCTRKECSSAQLNLYTAHSCRQYFGVSCSVNKNLNGCETGQSFCMDYNHSQCISNGQINLNGVECFWNEDKSTCQERICANGPSNASSHQECANFLSTCQKGGCRIKGCFDYQYAIDSACASIFEDKRCVTNGIRCVLRKECKDINIEDGCKFDINLNPCVWIDEKCYSKTCQTAQVALTKHGDCNSYLSYCTVKQGGGCTNKQSCKDYQIQEACFTDGENFECIWDVNISKCFSNQCIHFCGDGIVTGQEEQCDDGNYFPYDGCYRCQVQCPQGCNKCKGMLCQECNKNGWLLIEGVCNSKCGDGYVVGNEQCDDGNNFKFDGCYQCSYQCDEMCLDCFQGQCILCQEGYVEDGYQCNNICGDGYCVQQIEQCDDGNRQNNDGCSDNCRIEKDWKCTTENNISFCYYTIQPKITLNKLTKTDTSYQEFKLSFSEPVCLNVKGISEEQFLQLIIIEIINAKNNQYDIEVKSMVSITTELADVAYKILINFKTNVKDPVLKVTVNNDNIVNSQGNNLLTKEAKLEFRSPYKLSTFQMSLISKTSMLSRIVLYFIIFVSGISFLSGNLEILWNLLDLLQQLSYMKFHNVEFPQNLESYFQIFTMGSFTPIFDNIQIDQTLQGLFNYQTPIILAKWKFEYYQINCYFLQNFQTLLIMLILGFTYYIISYLFLKFLILSNYQNWPAVYQSNYHYKATKFIFFIQRFARKYYQYFIYSGLIRIFTSNFYELTYASILQLVNFNTETTLNLLISYLALITLICNAFLLCRFIFYLSQKNVVAKNLSVLVEGIKDQTNQRTKQYFTILLIKKTLFILNLVVMQGLVEAQCLLSAFLSGAFFFYCCIYKPFRNRFENLKIILTEVLIMLNVSIFSLYEILKLNQNKESAESVGWVNIFGFTLILLSTLAIDIYQSYVQHANLILTKFKRCLKLEKEISQRSRILFF